MKLIIERLNDQFYAFTEDEDHHRIVESGRSKEAVKLPPEVLEEECNLDLVLSNDSYIILELK